MAHVKNLVTYQSISYQETKEISKLLAYKIEKEFQPELLLFVARGGHIIAHAMQEVLNIPMIDIDCSSNRNKKSDLFIPYLPDIVKKTIRKSVLFKNNPNKTFQKYITYSKQQWKLYQTVNRILIVDDTIETAKTIHHILPMIQDYFKDADIKIATLANFNHSIVDYQVYQNKILSGPWGRDSRDYKVFLKHYEDYKKQKEQKQNMIKIGKQNQVSKQDFISYLDPHHLLEKNKVKIKSFTK